MLLVKFERLQQRLSQDVVGLVAHIPQPIISLIECGRLVPTPAQLERLAKALNVQPPEALLEPVTSVGTERRVSSR